jgi:polysaccharide biosynthesis transport protein
MAQTNGDELVAAAPKRGGGLNVRSVVHAVKQRPLAFIGVIILGGVVAAAVWFFLPLPKATAAIVFRIPFQAPALLPTAESRGDSTVYRQSEVTLVKRRLNLNGVLNQPAVRSLELVRKQSDAMSWLDNALKVEAKINTEFIRVTIEGENGEDLKTILEALGKTYLADADDRDKGARRRRLATLEETDRVYRTELERFQSRIDKIALSLGSKDGPTLAIIDSLLKDDLRSAVHELSAARDQLLWAELDLAGAAPADAAGEKGVAEVTLPWGFGKARLPGGAIAVSPVQIEEELRQDAGFKELEAKLVHAREALAETKARYKEFKEGEKPIAVVNAEAALKAAEEKRDKLRDELRPRLEAAVRDKLVRNEQTRLAGLRTAVDSLKKKEELAKKKVDEIQRGIGKSNDYRIDLETIKSSIGQTERLSTRLADEIEQIKVELGAPPRVTLAEEAFIVPGIEGNRRLKFTFLAAVGVVGIGFFLIVMWEHRSRRVLHTDDVASLGIRLIGAVPTVNRDPQPGGESHPVLVEAIDATRTLLLNGTHDSELRVLVVTSAVSGEGKTSLSGHLAISLARAGYRTLLVDGDLRAPTAQRVFELPLSPGLCEFLRGEVGVAAAQPTLVPGLSVLTAGEWTTATRQTLVGNGWRTVIDKLKADFDYVIVDTSPLLLVSDTLLLAREADGVVISVLMGVSQVALVNEALARLQAVRAKVTGVIANGVRSAAHEYAHGYRSRVIPALPVSSKTVGVETTGR